MKTKFWTLFFDENGTNQAGSDWAIPIPYKEHYPHPKNAVGFLILPDYAFKTLSYEEIKDLYKHYGCKL